MLRGVFTFMSALSLLLAVTAGAFWRCQYSSRLRPAPRPIFFWYSSSSGGSPLDGFNMESGAQDRFNDMISTAKWIRDYLADFQVPQRAHVPSAVSPCNSDAALAGIWFDVRALDGDAVLPVATIFARQVRDVRNADC
jgi:hypothetical protein